MCQKNHFRLPFPLHETQTCFDRVDYELLTSPSLGYARTHHFFAVKEWIMEKWNINRHSSRSNFCLFTFFSRLPRQETGKTISRGKWKLSLKMMIWNIEGEMWTAEEKHSRILFPCRHNSVRSCIFIRFRSNHPEIKLLKALMIEVEAKSYNKSHEIFDALSLKHLMTKN